MNRRDSECTGERIVATMLRNMVDGAEPIFYSVLVPAYYRVYLNSEDFRRLRAIFPRIQAEGANALSEELERLNNPLIPFARRRKRYESAAPAWQIYIYEDPNGEVQAGQVAVSSELAIPQNPGLGGPLTIKRTLTFDSETKGRTLAVANVNPEVTAAKESAQEAAPENCLALITYRGSVDNGVYRMTKSEILVGRAGEGVSVDLALKHPSVSREHLRIRRHPEGTFVVENLGEHGATLNGVAMPRSVAHARAEMSFSGVAVIGLAGQSAIIEIRTGAR